MIPNLSRRAAITLKIESFNSKNSKNRIISSKNRRLNIFKLSIFRLSAARQVSRVNRDPQISAACRDWFISRLFLSTIS
jgi:hypothetical protein